MKCDFTFKHMESFSGLAKYTNFRLQDVSKLLLKEGRAHVEFSKDKKNQFVCEITIQSGTGYFKAKGCAENFHDAIEDVCYKLEKQIMKNKDINQKHKGFERSKRGRHEYFNKVIENSYFSENYDYKNGYTQSSKKVA